MLNEVFILVLLGQFLFLFYFIYQAHLKSKLFKEGEVKLGASINSLNIGFILVDTKNNILTMNGAAKRILCMPDSFFPPGIIRPNSNLNVSCTFEDIEKELNETIDLRQEIVRSLSERKTIDIRELRYKELFLHIFISPIVMYKKSLEVLGAVILVEDITQQKILERSKEEFFSIASHELRTPLTAIRGNASMIKQYCPQALQDPMLKEMIDDIQSSSIRLIEIVNDFLDASRLEQGKIGFRFASFDIKELIFEVFKELSSVAKEKNLNLSLAQGDYPLVYADRNRLKQVLINLVGNAIKFTEQGGITISLSEEAPITKVSSIDQGFKASQHRFLKVLLADTGKGIPLPNQKLLFRKFQQAENNLLTRDNTRGTGLGLYISKLMIEGIGGRIWLEGSEVSKGSTFAFTLPIAETDFDDKK